jgi:hypothetical protein
MHTGTHISFARNKSVTGFAVIFIAVFRKHVLQLLILLSTCSTVERGPWSPRASLFSQNISESSHHNDSSKARCRPEGGLDINRAVHISIEVDGTTNQEK